MPKQPAKTAKTSLSGFITIRIPRGLYEEVSDLAPHFATDVKGITGRGVVSKATALRLVIARGIKAIKASKSKRAR